MPLGNNNSHIISCSHYTIINHTSSYFRDPGPVRELDVVDVGGQRVGAPQVKRSEIKNTAPYLISTLNIEIALVEIRSKLVKKYDKKKKKKIRTVNIFL